MSSKNEHYLIKTGWAIVNKVELEYLRKKYEVKVYEKSNGNYVIKMVKNKK